MKMVSGSVMLFAAEEAYAHANLVQFPNHESASRVLVPASVVFLALGVFVGMRVFASHRSEAFDGNPQAQASLGISPRELAVLHELAAGRSNKEIAAELNVSPNTVKTHVARLFEKLGAKRRTDAINRARELGIVP